MSFRVCIPCAGTGSRLGSLTQFINKSLVSIANRPTISHLIERFPVDTEFVIPLGYKGHLVREFLTLAYPDRTFYFEEVSPFEGPGSGLGLSLLSCKQHLQQPFIFISCDTLVDENIPAPTENWMGYAISENPTQYRTVRLSEGKIVDISEKGEAMSDCDVPYIGLAGIYDHELFWNVMMEGGEEAIAVGEAYGLKGLLGQGIAGYKFTWHDTGNSNSLSKCRQHFREDNAPNILDKANEAIWFIGSSVIKFSDSESFVSNRVRRASQLAGFVPPITGTGKNMYRYSKVEGKVLSEIVNLPHFEKLLEFSQNFWSVGSLSPIESNAFRERCMHFYREKTLERVNLFYKNFSRSDGAETINGWPMPTLKSLLGKLDWDWLAEGLPGRFHGDFHFENIIWSTENKFVLLDWRQDFDGDISVGDIYYDLAKLLHGLIISHELIAKDLFEIDWNNKRIDYDFNRKQILVECEHYFGEWLKINGYDLSKVKILTALIFLNIAALHHNPYSLLLYALGKFMLNTELEKMHAN